MHVIALEYMYIEWDFTTIELKMLLSSTEDY